MTDKHLSPTRAKRKGLSAKVRFDVFKRDGFVCQYCAEVAAHRGLRNDNDTFKYFCGICWKMSKE